ncbi:MAG: RagB/SusD family nutrient uptake outer membrane protein [Candidatus Cryptobacteroides sp.]
MKKIINLITILAAGALICSCSDFISEALDQEPSDRYSPTAVWASESSADQYLLGFYNFIKENTGNLGGDNNMTGVTDAYSDILKSNSWSQYNHPFNSAFLQAGSFSSQSAGCFECWSDCYTRIRRCNEYLRDVTSYGAKFGSDFVESRSAEVKFIRACAYFKLMKVYGKCIIRDQVDGPAENDKPFATTREAWDFIESDLIEAGNKVATDLPAGRITRAAAWGYLSRVALFAEDWQLVVDAADSARRYGAALDPSYSNVFNDIRSVENLLTVEFLQNKLTHRADVFFRPLGDGAEGSLHEGANIYAVFNPTSEYVDLFEMADGTPFDWEIHGADPYTGREPRFYASILYNGAKWEGRTIETHDTGKDKIVEFNTSGAAGSTVTGYYLRKFITEDQTGWEKYGSDHFAIVIRYGEVLLNEAEGYARLGDFDKAYACLNQVRGRVGLPEKNGSDIDTFMNDLRKERVVELGGEGQRFWDLRRWRIAVCDNSEDSVIDGKNFHGCWITKKEDGSFTYKQVVVDGADKIHFFPERYYAFAIPVTELSNNGALDPLTDNNPGW